MNEISSSSRLLRTQRGVAATKHAALCSPVFSGDTNALQLLPENRLQRFSVTRGDHTSGQVRGQQSQVGSVDLARGVDAV
jgi:hypothetical protein